MSEIDINEADFEMITRVVVPILQTIIAKDGYYYGAKADKQTDAAFGYLHAILSRYENKG
jgi:hypothetical protein